ncbi:o-succinylbenzoate--CoA ligase [Vibrio sp. 10N.286.49.B3]|nr:o-succinylbenzoate--CoA ligase [Vibrio sp. 10N.286.49.B3]
MSGYTFLSLLSQWVDIRPHDIAYITAHHDYTWQELALVTAQYQSKLHTQGLQAGDVLLLVGKNSPELVCIYLACLSLGICPAFSPIQPYMQIATKLNTLYKPGEYGKYSRAYLWFDQLSLSSHRQQWMTSDNERLKQQVTLINLPMLDTLSIDEYDVDCTKRDCQDLDQLASIIFTSGSTGTPKAVLHTSGQHIASAKGLLNRFAFGQEDCWLLSLPMYHVSGLAIIWRWLVAGGQLKVGQGNLNQDIKGVTHASLVATQLARLLQTSEVLSLQRVLLGGSHIPLSLGQQAATQGIDTWIGYGMTEAASTVTMKRVDGKNSVGSVISHRKVKVAQQTIYIAGDTLAQGYYKQGEVTSLLDSSGWYNSQDLGCWLDGDELQIIGRADNLFISGGENIHCEEIEAALNAHPLIEQAFILAVEDSEFGARPIAIVQTQQLESIERYNDFLRDKLDKFKWPIFYFHMPELPHSGIKVSRQALKSWLTAHQNNFRVI